MNISRISAVVLAATVPVIAHAQISQIFGAIHTAQYAVTEAKQLLPQQSGENSPQASQATSQPQAPAQNQQDAFRATQPQRTQDGRQQAQQMVAEQNAEDIRKYKQSQQRDVQQAQQQRDAAKKIIDLCPDLADSRFNSAERIIRCRNKGLTESQQMTLVGGLPVLAQAYAASMVQDVYEDNITDPNRGKAISDYYNGCLQRGTPCARPKW
ncbi:hypothetical protein J3L14_28325 [Burkholderia pseudomallei]|nr:hypothetical protein J3L14_28325 [Burkholderia pseudomallei]